MPESELSQRTEDKISELLGPQDEEIEDVKKVETTPEAKETSKDEELDQGVVSKDLDVDEGEVLDPLSEVKDTSIEVKDEDVSGFTPAVLEELNKLAGFSTAQVAEREPKKVETPTRVADDEARKLPEIDFISGIGDEEINDPKTINKLLNQVYAQAMQTMMQVIPGQINQISSQQVGLQLLAHRFYIDNPDLASYKNLVGRTATELVSKDPTLATNPEKLYVETGKVVRKKYGLVKPLEERASPHTQKPTGTRPVNRVSKVVSEMDQDMKDLMGSDF